MDPELNFLTKKSSAKGGCYGIDASSANKHERTGVENYALHLIEAMKEHPLQEGERVFLYSPDVLNDLLDTYPQGWSSRVLRWPLRLGWMKIRMGWEMLRRAPDVLFVPSQGLPGIIPKKTVTMIHDVGFARAPKLYDNKTRKRLKSVHRRAIRKATRLLVPTVFTKQELMSAFKVPAEKIIVSPEAPDKKIYKQLDRASIQPILQRHRLNTNFFLFVGRLDQKKNIVTLIKAFELFKTSRGYGDPFELVLVGSPGFGYDWIKKHIDLSSHKAQIKVLGYRSDEEVSAFMNACTAFVFPSWYEGFGIPNLEAMACGAPLITSDIDPHREVCGDAALFVSPKEPQQWARAMTQITKEGTLRDELSKKGLAHVAEYDWSKTATITWELLRSLV
jgi:glycosyltransferase involved in cell wall biosynthesis